MIAVWILLYFKAKQKKQQRANECIGSKVFGNSRIIIYSNKKSNTDGSLLDFEYILV